MSNWIHVELADDWCGLYVDGVRVDQNHSLDWPYLLERHPLPTAFRQERVLDEYLDGHNDLPVAYTDIPKDMLEPM